MDAGNDPIEAAVNAVAEQLWAYATVAATRAAPHDPAERRSIERRLRDAVEGVLDALDDYGVAMRDTFRVTVPWVLPAALSVERSLVARASSPQAGLHDGEASVIDVVGRWRYHVPDTGALLRHGGTNPERGLDDTLAVLLHRLGFADVDPLGHVPEELLQLDVAEVVGTASDDTSTAPEHGWPADALPAVGERPLTAVRIGVAAPGEPGPRRSGAPDPLTGHGRQ